MQNIENARIYEASLVPANTLPPPWDEICIVEIVGEK